MGDPCRLYLVPEDVMSRWKVKQRLEDVDYPRVAQTVEADKSVKDALEARGLSDYDKNKLLEQKTGAFLGTHDRQNTPLSNNPPPPPPPPPTPTTHPLAEGGDSSSMLAGIPKTYRERANRLIQKLQADPRIKWDNQHRLSIDGREISGSNLLDLVSDAVSRRESGRRPQGFAAVRDYFRSEIPLASLLNNRAWRSSDTGTTFDASTAAAAAAAAAAAGGLSPFHTPAFSTQGPGRGRGSSLRFPPRARTGLRLKQKRGPTKISFKGSPTSGTIPFPNWESPDDGD